ncbi:Rieske (2Fe-2S) protein [Rhodococcus sp. X156]|uniref:Rieske (2Fe-2S) protein n=1 Tax=Rhodococcus sp. X156 TaxID=2499145 RepID=UPI000FDA76EC|nr:Rieske (2Fe-2S) protein [Rhodococcus sp. X156]
MSVHHQDTDHQNTRSTPRTTRRTVLCGLGLGLLAPGALAACSAGKVGGGTPPVSAEPGTALAALAEVPVGGGAVVNGPDGKVLLTQPTAGTVKAYQAACPHAGSIVSPPSDGVVVCPAHGSRFSAADGAVRQGPARTPLVPVAVTVSGPDVVLA